jgi:hypothetical protein
VVVIPFDDTLLGIFAHFLLGRVGHANILM